MYDFSELTWAAWRVWHQHQNPFLNLDGPQTGRLSESFANSMGSAQVSRHLILLLIKDYHCLPWQSLSVQFSCSVVSDSLRPYGLQHTRLPCPSPTPRVHPNPCPLSSWCHPTISSSVVPFSSLLQSCPASGSFQMSQFFASGGQSFGASASTSVLPMNIQDWSFRMDWLDLLAGQGKRQSLWIYL